MKCGENYIYQHSTGARRICQPGEGVGEPVQPGVGWGRGGLDEQGVQPPLLSPPQLGHGDPSPALWGCEHGTVCSVMGVYTTY